MFTYKIYLTYLKTKETKIIVEDCVYSEEGLEYLWTEGNYSCDWNRSLFFGLEEQLDCNLEDNQIVLNKIERSDGKILFEED